MTTPVIIDAVAVAVLAGFAILGAWRGLLRTLAGLLVLALSAAGRANMWAAVFADVGVSVLAILNASRMLKAK